MDQAKPLDYMSRTDIENAKARLRIPELWTRYTLPGKPAKSCRCPFHDDRKNSFSITQDGLLWNCFGQCAVGGDAVDFVARVCRLDRKTAFKTFLKMAGGVSMAPARFTITKSATSIPRQKPKFPPLEIGTRADLVAVAKLRGIPLAALQWANERGVLRFATLQGYPAWIVTDGEGVNAQARRLDGGLWEHLDGNPKAWTLAGAWASWPLGIREAKNFPAIALCEGGPDFLTAHYFAWWEQLVTGVPKCAPVAMLGASQRIHGDALPLFAEKHVRIFCHADDAGRKAAAQWKGQLNSVGVMVDAFDFTGLIRANGKPAKDLNDCIVLDAESFSQMGRIMP